MDAAWRAPNFWVPDDEFLEDGNWPTAVFQRSRTLTEQAADQIRERIVKGSLALGEALS